MVVRRATAGSLYGTNRDDTLTGIAQAGTTAIHLYARKGDDALILDFAEGITGYAAGHHARGDGDTNRPRGADSFNFVNTAHVASGGIAVGRLEDLDAADRILIDGVLLDLRDLPPNVRIVAFAGAHNDPDPSDQQWLLIQTASGGQIFYALEGARIDMTGDGGTSSGRMESHFIPADMLPDFSRLRDIVYIDPENTLPPGAQPEGGIAIKDHDRTVADVRRPIVGGLDGDVIAAGLNGDTVEARGGNDTVWAGSGDDRVLGGAGADHLRGGFGSDLLAGHSGADTLNGGAGRDTLFGGNGHDALTGGRSADALWGGGGDDWLNGGYGNDTMTGGDGADRFFHDGPAAAFGTEWIGDYDADEDDLLVLGPRAPGGADAFAVSFAATPGRGGDAAEAFVRYLPTGAILWALVDAGEHDAITVQTANGTFDLLA